MLIVPNAAIFILEINLIGANFYHMLDNLVLSRERASCNQQNAMNCNFRQAS